KSGTAGAAVEFIERRKQRFASDDVDVNARPDIVPILVLKRRLGAVLACNTILLRLQSGSQSRVVRDRPIWIKAHRFIAQRVGSEHQINDSADQNGTNDDPDTHAYPRSVVASDSSAVHRRASLSTLNQKTGRTSLFFIEKTKILGVALGLHLGQRDEVQGCGIDGITPARWRCWVGKYVAEMRIAFGRTDLRSLHAESRIAFFEYAVG